MILPGWRLHLTAKHTDLPSCWMLTSTTVSEGTRAPGAGIPSRSAMTLRAGMTAESSLATPYRRKGNERTLQSILRIQERAVFTGYTSRRNDEASRSCWRKGSFPVCRGPGGHSSHHRRCRKRQVLSITVCLSNIASFGISCAVCYGHLRNHRRTLQTDMSCPEHRSERKLQSHTKQDNYKLYNGTR